MIVKQGDPKEGTFRRSFVHVIDGGKNLRGSWSYPNFSSALMQNLSATVLHFINCSLFNVIIN